MSVKKLPEEYARRDKQPSDLNEENAQRQAVVEAAKTIFRSGLSPGRSGNVSVRYREGALITPCGILYELLEPSDIVFVPTHEENNKNTNSLKPSSEWRFHVSAYRCRPDCNAVVHTHSLHATVLACAHREIPSFHYMVATAGGTHIPLVPYALFGTQKLSDLICGELRHRDALLLANHGQIAIGNSLPKAMELAFHVETLSEQYYKVLTLGAPKILNKNQMDDVFEQMKIYGQKKTEK